MYSYSPFTLRRIIVGRGTHGGPSRRRPFTGHLIWAGRIWKTDLTTAEETSEELTDASCLHIEANGDYAFRPFVAELLAVLGDHKSREKVLQRYLAVTEHRY